MAATAAEKLKMILLTFRIPEAVLWKLILDPTSNISTITIAEIEEDIPAISKKIQSRRFFLNVAKF